MLPHRPVLPVGQQNFSHVGITGLQKYPKRMFLECGLLHSAKKRLSSNSATRKKSCNNLLE